MSANDSKTALVPKDGVEDPLSLVGETIDGIYRIDALVGEGGFGVVYRAFHLQFQHPIAVKCLKIPGSLDETTRKDFLRKFQEEGRLLFQLSQGSFEIVRAIALGDTVTPTDIWTPFVVLEWLEGRSMAEVLKERKQAGKGGMALGEVLAWLDRVARAFAYAHEKHVAHRDIKPANLFVLDRRDEHNRQLIKILDFGIAKVVEHGSPTEAGGTSKTSFASFTPQYAAPEQFNPSLGVTGPWSDVYSFALLVVEMLSGHPALQARNAYSLMKMALDEARRPTPRTLGLDVPDGVERVFAKALQLDPRNRYPSMGPFWNELTAAVETERTRRVPRKKKEKTVAIAPGISRPAPARPPSAAPLPTPAPFPSYQSSPGLPTPPQDWQAAPFAQQPRQDYPLAEPWAPPPTPAPPSAPAPPTSKPASGALWLAFGILLGIVLVIVFSGMVCSACVCASL